MSTERLISTSDGTESGAFASRDWLLIAVAGLMWGGSFLFIAEGLESFAPGAVTFLRILFGLGALSLANRRSDPIVGSDRKKLFLLAVTWMAFPLTMFPLAEQRLSSSVAGMINGATPVTVAIVAAILLKRLPGRWQLAGLAIGVVGLIFIAQPSIDDGGNSAVGVALIVSAVASYGLALNLAVPLQQRYGSINVLWRALGIAAVVTLPYGLIGLNDSTVEPIPLLAIIALGAGGTGLAFVAMATVAGRAGSTRASVTVYLTPPVAIVLGVLIRDEEVAGLAVAGAALVLVGAWIAGRPDTARPVGTLELSSNS